LYLYSDKLLKNKYSSLLTGQSSPQQTGVENGNHGELQRRHAVLADSRISKARGARKAQAARRSTQVVGQGRAPRAHCQPV